MLPIPIPDGVAEAAGGKRIVIGPTGDPTGDIRPCEYVVTPSKVVPGGVSVSTLVELDDDDRVLAAAGRPLWLTFEGGELPWSLEFDIPAAES